MEAVCERVAAELAERKDLHAFSAQATARLVSGLAQLGFKTFKQTNNTVDILPSHNPHEYDGYFFILDSAIA